MTTQRYVLDPTRTFVGFSIRHRLVRQQRRQLHDVIGRLSLDRAEGTTRIYRKEFGLVWNTILDRVTADGGGTDTLRLQVQRKPS